METLQAWKDPREFPSATRFRRLLVGCAYASRGDRGVDPLERTCRSPNSISFTHASDTRIRRADGPHARARNTRSAAARVPFSHFRAKTAIRLRAAKIATLPPEWSSLRFARREWCGPQLFAVACIPNQQTVLHWGNPCTALSAASCRRSEQWPKRRRAVHRESPSRLQSLRGCAEMLVNVPHRSLCQYSVAPARSARRYPDAARSPR